MFVFRVLLIALVRRAGPARGPRVLQAPGQECLRISSYPNDNVV